MATYTVTSKGSPVTFTSDFTDEQAHAALKDLTYSDFAQDLYHKGLAKLSAKQIAWVHKYAVDAAAKKAAAAAAPVASGFAPIPAAIETFDKAAEHLKYPKVQFPLPADVNGIPRWLRLKRNGAKSATPGAIAILVVSDVQSETGGKMAAYHGQIARDGSVKIKFNGNPLPAEAAAILADLAKDFAGTVAAAGKLTGCCCYCMQKLSTAESLSAGYGPDCAKHWGLQHGAVKPEIAAVVKTPKKAKAVENTAAPIILPETITPPLPDGRLW